MKAGDAYSDAAGRFADYPETINEDNLPPLFKRLCSDQCGLTADDVDQLFFTQISKSSIAIAAERCNVPVGKCHMIMQKYGLSAVHQAICSQCSKPC